MLKKTKKIISFTLNEGVINEMINKNRQNGGPVNKINVDEKTYNKILLMRIINLNTTREIAEEVLLSRTVIERILKEVNIDGDTIISKSFVRNNKINKLIKTIVLNYEAMTNEEIQEKYKISYGSFMKCVKTFNIWRTNEIYKNYVNCFKEL